MLIRSPQADFDFEKAFAMRLSVILIIVVPAGNFCSKICTAILIIVVPAGNFYSKICTKILLFQLLS